MKMLALALLVGAEAFVTNPARSLRNFGMRTATRNVAAPQMLFGLTRVRARPNLTLCLFVRRAETRPG